jgi:hypothetical protein
LIPARNDIAKLELVRDEGRRHNGVALPQFVTYVVTFRDEYRTRDQRQPSLDSLQLAALLRWLPSFQLISSGQK